MRTDEAERDVLYTVDQHYGLDDQRDRQLRVKSALRQNIAFLNVRLLANANDKKKRHAPMRFEALLDPLNNWVVWDTKEEYFAEVGTRYLLSLPEQRAKAFCAMLNILFLRDAELLTTDTVACVAGASTIT